METSRILMNKEDKEMSGSDIIKLVVSILVWRKVPESSAGVSPYAIFPPGYNILKKPPYTHPIRPSDLVWITLYLLMGLASLYLAGWIIRERAVLAFTLFWSSLRSTSSGLLCSSVKNLYPAVPS